MSAPSLLAVVLTSDEDDCSVAEVGIYDPGDPRFSSALNVRCALHPDALHPIDRYVRGFERLRPERLLVAAIAGVPVDLVADPDDVDHAAILGDPRMRVVVDPESDNDLLPACDLGDDGR